MNATPASHQTHSLVDLPEIDDPTDIIDIDTAKIAQDLRVTDPDVTDEMVEWVVSCKQAERARRLGHTRIDYSMYEIDIRGWDLSLENFGASP